MSHQFVVCPACNRPAFEHEHACPFCGECLGNCARPFRSVPLALTVGLSLAGCHRPSTAAAPRTAPAAPSPDATAPQPSDAGALAVADAAAAVQARGLLALLPANPPQGYGTGAGVYGLAPANVRPLVRAGPPTVHGLLSPEAIRRVVLRNLSQVSHCHEQVLFHNPASEGRIVIHFVIAEDGHVASSVVAPDSAYPVASGETCVAEAFTRWRFPAPEGHSQVDVTYPFMMQHPE